jgi:DNA-binding response OmpR family regulator
MKDILIIEEDQAIREVLGLYCNHCRQNCICVCNIGEGFKELEKKNPSLILLDLSYHTENLPEFIRKARQSVSNPRIFIMSAMNGAEEIARNNDVSFIAKPFHLDLIEKIICE